MMDNSKEIGELMTIFAAYCDMKQPACNYECVKCDKRKAFIKACGALDGKEVKELHDLRQRLRPILNRFGRVSQISKAIEELSELSRELSREIAGGGSVEDIAGEMADVFIMLEQLKIIYCISDEHLEDLIGAKIQRTYERYHIEGAKKWENG